MAAADSRRGASRRGASLRRGALRSLATALRTAARPGAPGIGTRLTSLPRLVRATTKGVYDGTSGRRLLALAGALLYVVSPVDLVPEIFLPFLGLGDDALVITWVAASLVNETESFLRWERDRDRIVRGHVIR